MGDAEGEGGRESTVFRSAPFGKYTLLRKLGKGGMGRVFEALDTVLNRRVAVKMMAPPEPGYRLEAAGVDEERFLREAQLSATLSKHPHIVSVYEAGAIDGRRFLAMEYVDGLQMQDWRLGRPAREQIEVLRDIALGVHHAHEQGVLHRDLKPANVIVDARGRPHITDFGLAKTLAPEFQRGITTSGIVVGTPAYMSPEQAQGLREVDARSDVYSLGVMMYEILTGQGPFEAETAMQLLVKVVEHEPPKPSTRVADPASPARDPRLETLCLRALSKKPEERPASAREFGDALGAWLEATGPSGRAGGNSIGRRRPQLVVAAVVVFLVILAFVIRSQPARAPMPSVLSHHAGKVIAVAFSPEGRWLASGGEDRKVLLWEIGTRSVHPFGALRGKVEAIAFSSRGDRVAAVTEPVSGQPAEVAVWSVPGGNPVHELDVPSSGINCVAFSPDGRWIVSGDKDGSVACRDSVSGRPLWKETAHASAVRGVAFTPDGLRLVTASWDHTARVRDVASRKELLVLRGHAQGLWSVAVSPDGTTLATASSDRTCKLWEASTGVARLTIAAHAAEVACVRFSPDGRRLATSSWDRTAKLWDATTGAPLGTFEGHTDSVWCVAFSPDGRTLATAGLDGKIRLWELPE